MEAMSKTKARNKQLIRQTHSEVQLLLRVRAVSRRFIVHLSTSQQCSQHTLTLVSLRAYVMNLINSLITSDLQCSQTTDGLLNITEQLTAREATDMNNWKQV